MPHAAISTQGALARLPLFLLVFGGFSALMLVTAAYAMAIGFERTGRAFLYTAILNLVFFALIAAAHWGRAPRHGPLGPVAALVAVFMLLPLILAVPFHQAIDDIRFLDVYLEMVSAITTTGAPVFDTFAQFNPALHLWRALVAWMGGLLILIAAATILAPMNLAGVEPRNLVQSHAAPGSGRVDIRMRIAASAATLLPIYAGLTLLLWLLLVALGDPGLIALCHAMAILSTSGISPLQNIGAAPFGVAGEAVTILFFVFAFSRRTFATDRHLSNAQTLWHDPELRFGIWVCLSVSLLLFMRHWFGAYGMTEKDTLGAALTALWGSVFTTASFLTTTGFVSASWADTQNWSGLDTPGLVLMGLALTGGGVATTAGGVKLLRVYILYTNGKRDLRRLVHPSSVDGMDAVRYGKADGAVLPWLAVMLFAVALGAIVLTFTALSIPFDTAMILASAALSTTGPLILHAAEPALTFASLGDGPKLVFGLAMIVGRLEVLAIMGLMTPGLWRDV